MNSVWKKRLILVAKIVIVLAIFGWIGWELQKSWNKINRIQWTPNYYWLILSAFFYGISYIPSVLFWRHTMWLFGQHPGWYETFRAYYIGHLGKYIPGKAMVVILRASLLNRERTQLSVAAATVILETLNMMAIGGFISALIMVLWFRDLSVGNYLTFIAVGLMFFIGLPVFPPIFRRFAKQFGVGSNDPEINQKLQKLRFRTIFYGWSLMSIDWVLLGLSLWATIQGVGINTGTLIDHFPQYVLAATLSVVVGFVLMIPGGLGVREIIITQITIPLLVTLLMNADSELTKTDAAELAVLYALVIAGVQRGISILSELFISAILYCRWK
ncbi:MAG: lysylphosphatidylglycerol synthase domain-containing protein [Planctomycetaceae bacterium]|jgi:uncharacterized membrane protein YbhN (UPF0104 family)|nr:lysylphosphatidylglycerol synthase domain-containing protein [Planctomycetaceae bacterium]